VNKKEMLIPSYSFGTLDDKYISAKNNICQRRAQFQKRRLAPKRAFQLNLELSCGVEIHGIWPTPGTAYNLKK
jgi:hypothetical protein